MLKKEFIELSVPLIAIVVENRPVFISVKKIKDF